MFSAWHRLAWSCCSIMSNENKKKKKKEEKRNPLEDVPAYLRFQNMLKEV